MNLGAAAAGLVAHTLYLIVTMREEAVAGANIAPLSSWYAWCLIVAWVIAASYFGLAVRRTESAVWIFLLPLVLTLIGLAVLFRDAPPFPRNQAVSYWRIIHGVALLMGTVAVTLGFAAGVMYLFQSYRLKHKLPPNRGFRLPSLEWLQRCNTRSLLLSTCLLAVGLLSGIVLNACLAWILEQAWCGRRNVNHWWIAPYYGQAKIAYRRMKNGLGQEAFRGHDGELWVRLHSNGAYIWFKSGENPDALYGEDVYSAVIDEASRVREESWHAVRSTLTATRGPIRIIGNVKGKKNWAYRMGPRAEAGEIRMAYHRIIAHDAVDAGIIAAEEVEDAKRDLPESVLNELYLAIPSEDGSNPFGVQAIRDCIVPMFDTTPVVWGWDLALKQDWTVGVALDASGRVCRLERWQRSWPETEDTIARLTEGTLTLLDSTGVGDPGAGTIA